MMNRHRSTPWRAAALPAAVAISLMGATPALAASKAPSLKRDGYRLTWSGGPSAGGKGYELRSTARKRRTTTIRVRATSVTPTPQSAKKVTYRVRVRGSRSWSKPVSVSYAAPAYLGANASPASDDRRTEQTLLQGNVKTVKQGVDFARVEPTRGKRDWGDLDARMADLRRAGFNVTMGVEGYTYGPDWAKNDPAAYRSFVAEVVRRYGPGTAADVTWFEPVNEPYYVTGARGGQVRIGTFAQDWVRLVKAARRKNPDARFLIPASSDVYDTATKKWRVWGVALKQSQRTIGRYIDGIAVHPYTNGMSPLQRASATVNVHSTFLRIDLINRAFRSVGINRPTFITELGWATPNPGHTVDVSHKPVSRETQARYLNDVVDLVRTRTWVGGVFFYSWRDYAGGNKRSDQDMGLMTSDWKPKPSYDYLVETIRRRGGR